jgi:hypothetical protein
VPRRGADRRVLILAFDALRPDMVTPAVMPNLCAFADAGFRFPHSRSTFPTETRVNQSALVTGCYPQRHGIVGNKFLDPVAAPGKLFNTGDETQLADGDRRLGGKLVDVPVMGEILDKAGKSLAVVSAGTPGGCRMLSHKAEELGLFRLALHRPDASVPAACIAEVQQRLGPIPPHAIPSLDWLTYTTDVYLDYIEPVLCPDVTVLWYCEPDNSYHYEGIGTAPNLRALRHLDAELGRILDWRDRGGPGGALQIITLSDHGQITVAAESIDIAGQMRAAGFTVGETVSDGADAALALSSAGGIYVRDSDPALIRRLVAWLQHQSWCGPVSTRDGDGALRHDQLLIDHRRAPDIGLVLASDNRANSRSRTRRICRPAGFRSTACSSGTCRRSPSSSDRPSCPPCLPAMSASAPRRPCGFSIRRRACLSRGIFSLNTLTRRGAVFRSAIASSATSGSIGPVGRCITTMRYRSGSRTSRTPTLNTSSWSSAAASSISIAS